MPDAVTALIVERLRAAGCVFAEDEAAILVAAEGDPQRLEALVAQRVEGIPLEHLVGWAEFAGLRIYVEPQVFVPRRRTRHLVKLAVSFVEPGSIVVDLCCGSGAVGAAIAVRAPGISLIAADIDPAAVRSARRNIHPPGLVVEGDLFAPLPHGIRGRVAVIVANAPYVPTASIALMPPEARLHEALVALDGGDDGLDVHRRVAAEAARWLAPGGRLIIETSVRQAPLTAALVEAGGMRARIVHSDKLDATAVVARLRA